VSDVGVGEPMILQPNGPAPQMKNFQAVWDTGATNCVISPNVVAQLNLKPTGLTQTHTASGPCQANTYLVNIYLPNRVYFPAIRVTEGQLGGTDVLIGMDIINKGDFSVTNVNGQTCMSFRFPSTKRIDYVQEFSQANAMAQQRLDPDFRRKERNRRKRERKK
jgi:predicted aspartyl protease